MKSEDENEEEEDGKRARTGGRDDRALARLAPSGAFGVPATPPRTKNEETRYGASWGCSIVFLDDALCAVPVGHGVLLVESKRGRQVAFVPGTPGQRRVTAIAAKKCFNERNNGGDDFDEERERGINGQRRRDAGSSSSISEPVVFTGETASLFAIAENGDEEIGPTVVLCAIHRQTQRRARLRTFSLRDAIGSDVKKSASSSSGAMGASMSASLSEYAFTEVCFSTDGASIIAKAQRVTDKNDWTLRSWTFSDLTKRINVGNGADVSGNQDFGTTYPFSTSCMYSDIFSVGKKSTSVSNVSYVIGFLPEPRISIGQRNQSTSHSNPASVKFHPRERNTVSTVAKSVIRMYKLPQKSEADLYAASSMSGSRGVIKLASAIPFGETFEADEPVDHSWLERGNGDRIVVAFKSGRVENSIML